MNKEEIIKRIMNNEVVIMPTDTVYGLMAKVSRDNEIKINQIKKSDVDKKISIIFPDLDTLFKEIDYLDEDRIALIKKNLPGKYTFIVYLKKEYVKALGFKRNDFGVRITSNKILQDIIKVTGPLLATSCNYSKEDVALDIDDLKKFNLPYLYTKKGEKKASVIIDLTGDEVKTIRF